MYTGLTLEISIIEHNVVSLKRCLVSKFCWVPCALAPLGPTLIGPAVNFMLVCILLVY